MIAIVNYNMGNLASVLNAFDKLGANAQVVSDPQELRSFQKVLLPGVGAYKDAMEHLRSNGMDEAIIDFTKEGRPLLGICLGMQLLLESSEEFGHTQGLGLIPGEVVAFDKERFEAPMKVPHMGWNKTFTKQSKLFEGTKDSFYLYYVHSFHAKTDPKYTIATSHYGYEFAAAVGDENIYGIQPHPEKSHDNGLAILKNFITL